jgi:hypothetical protein
MDILVNGSPLTLEARPGASLGEVLADADALIEKAGSIIVGIKIDGEELSADGYAEAAKRPAQGVGSVEIGIEEAREVRIRTIGTFLELLALIARAAGGEAPEGAGEASAEDWASLREGATDIRDAFGGLFAADELSFVKLLAETLDGAGTEPGAAARAEMAAQAARCASVFGERLAELRDPVAEMRTAAALFEARAPDLADLPVLLQTGKEDQAMKTVLYFIEVFNKVIRVIPELRHAGVDSDGLRIGAQGLAEFYGSFNGVLRELTEAFEHKDAVLIGDLAEYEILPRMRSFFAAMGEDLPS